MPTYIPGARVQQGPGWANLAANRQGVQSLLSGLAAIQDAQKQRAQQQQLSQLAQIIQMPPEQRQSALAGVMNRPDPDQSGLSKLINPVNPWGTYGGPTAVDQAIGQSALGQIMRDPMEIALQNARLASQRMRARDPYEGFTDQERAKARRIDAGLEPRASFNDPAYWENMGGGQGGTSMTAPSIPVTDEEAVALFDEAMSGKQKVVRKDYTWPKPNDEIYGGDAYAMGRFDFIAKMAKRGVDADTAITLFDDLWAKRYAEEANQDYQKFANPAAMGKAASPAMTKTSTKKPTMKQQLSEMVQTLTDPVEADEIRQIITEGNPNKMKEALSILKGVQ
jgi:hypothetical protein